MYRHVRMMARVGPAPGKAPDGWLASGAWRIYACLACVRLGSRADIGSD
jgi:hypothetical protein